MFCLLIGDMFILRAVCNTVVLTVCDALITGIAPTTSPTSWGAFSNRPAPPIHTQQAHQFPSLPTQQNFSPGMYSSHRQDTTSPMPPEAAADFMDSHSLFGGMCYCTYSISCGYLRMYLVAILSHGIQSATGTSVMCFASPLCCFCMY